MNDIDMWNLIEDMFKNGEIRRGKDCLKIYIAMYVDYNMETAEFLKMKYYEKYHDKCW